MRIETPDNYEARSVRGTVEVRSKEDGKNTIRGLAAVYDSLSENLGGFRERIEPGAFDEANMADVRGLFNHDTNFVLGRTTSKTVRLKTTERGLEYEIDLPDTQTIRDLVLEPIKRGDVDQSSFGFIVGSGNDAWDEDEEGRLIRTITGFQELFDVSPVTFPAYRDTDVGQRNAKHFQELQEQMARDAKDMLELRRRDGRLIDSLTRRAQLPR